MTTAIYFLGALSISLLSVLYLRHIDEKRTRVFHAQRKLVLPKFRLAGWMSVFLPGLTLLFIGQVSAFLSWCGAITVISWLMILQVPRHVRE